MGKTDEIRRLEGDLAADESLRERLEGAARRAAEAGAGSDGEAFAAAAAELGYGVSAADLERSIADAEQIDLDDLESAAGGWFWMNSDAEDGHEEWCAVAYHCFIALAHSGETVKDAACWQDYECALVYHTDMRQK
ncbi:MAG: hypothetical protein Q4B54_14490 [Coriobacteriales bacterium]|nr:hypothetical protein [Coriobacteriales bacterium]